jgi:hypothetical protein
LDGPLLKQTELSPNLSVIEASRLEDQRMNKPVPDLKANEHEAAAHDSPQFIDAIETKRRALRASLDGAGGLSPGIQGIMTTDEEVFDDAVRNDESEKKHD